MSGITLLGGCDAQRTYIIKFLPLRCVFRLYWIMFWKRERERKKSRLNWIQFEYTFGCLEVNSARKRFEEIRP